MDEVESSGSSADMELKLGRGRKRKFIASILFAEGDPGPNANVAAPGTSANAASDDFNMESRLASQTGRKRMDRIAGNEMKRTQKENRGVSDPDYVPETTKKNATSNLTDLPHNGCYRTRTRNKLQSSPMDFTDSLNNLIEGLSHQLTKKIKRREERLLLQQQRDLLNHPEARDLNSSYEDEQLPFPQPELSEEKREWVQRFIDSMSIDRVDYEKPNKSNIVEGIQHRRPTEVIPKFCTELADSMDTKTILERIDFEKERKRLSRLGQPTLDRWVRPKDTETCTPNFRTSNFAATSTPLEAVTKVGELDCPDKLEPPTVDIKQPNRENIKSCVQLFANAAPTSSPPRHRESDEGDFNLDFSHLDRSNITLRMPQTKYVPETENTEVDTPEPVPSPKQECVLPQNNNTNIMDYVDHLLNSDVPDIAEKVSQQCERILKRSAAVQNILTVALNDKCYANNDLDDSVQIIEDNSAEIASVHSVHLISDNESEVIPLINLSDTSSPSTSQQSNRRLRSHSKRANCKKNKNNESVVVIISPNTPTEDSSQPNFQPIRKRLHDCPICLESLSQKEISSTVCGHVFCTVCIAAAVRTSRSCPTCRTRLTLKKIHPLFI